MGYWIMFNQKDYNTELLELFNQACENQFDMENIAQDNAIFAVAEDFFFEGVRAAQLVYLKNLMTTCNNTGQ